MYQHQRKRILTNLNLALSDFIYVFTSGKNLLFPPAKVMMLQTCIQTNKTITSHAQKPAVFISGKAHIFLSNIFGSMQG